MKFKRILSALAALAVSATAFAGFAITADAATTTTLYERGYETNWNAATDSDGATIDDVVAWGNKASVDTTYGLHTTGTNSDQETSMTISPTDNAVITVDAKWVGMSNTGRYFSNGCASYFRFGNIYICQNDQDKASGYTLTGSIAGVTTFTGPNGYRDYDISTKNDYVIHMEIDTATNVLKSLTVKSSADLTKDLLNISDVALTNYDYKTIASGFKRGASHSTTHDEYLKAIKVTQTTQDVAKADYKINYTLTEGEMTTTIKTVEGSGVVGQEITADTKFEVETQRYYATDDAATSITLESGSENILNVSVRKAETYTVSAVPSTDTENVLASATVVEGDTWTYSYPKYITDSNGKVVASADNSTFTVTETPKASVVNTVPYTAYVGTAYFKEAESVYNTATISSANLSSGISSRGNTNAQTILTIPESGVYTITYAALTSNVGDGKGGTMSVYKNSADETNLLSSVSVDYISVNAVQTNGTVSVKNIELNAGDTIVTQGSMSTTSLDYVLAEKTGELTPTITAAVTTAEVDGVALPTLTTETAIKNTDNTDASYTYNGTDTVTTIYAKIDNAVDGTTPKIVINGEEQSSVWTPVTGTSIYFAQFVGAPADFGTVKITYTGAAEKEVNLVTE